MPNKAVPASQSLHGLPLAMQSRFTPIFNVWTLQVTLLPSAFDQFAKFAPYLRFALLDQAVIAAFVALASFGAIFFSVKVPLQVFAVAGLEMATEAATMKMTAASFPPVMLLVSFFGQSDNLHRSARNCQICGQIAWQ